MNTGLLWYDNKNPLVAVIAVARARYIEKFKCAPNIAYINEDTAPAEQESLRAAFSPLKLKIETKRIIQPHHVWLGVSVAREPVNQ